jgi:hypothetical protein
LDVPSVNFNEEQLSLRLEFIEGSNPMQFETLSIGAVQSGPSEAAISALDGGLITESSQDFDPLKNALTFVPFTDVAVGNSCTDFTTSPDGTRLAYTCPTGNRSEPNFSIVDMAPDDYFDSDG